MSRTDAILQRLLRLHPKLIDLGLERILRLLEDMGRPQDRLPPVIHVAGTNGKGSTIAFLRAFLEAAGQRVHVYTSPHLVHFRERIRLAGRLVADERLDAALEYCERLNAERPITFFEITTAAALHLFAEEPADFLLLEVGMGGEFDSTNVVDHPLGVVITPVAIDHQQFLGRTLPEIAKAKAGILKRGSRAVVGVQSPEAMHVIERTAARLGVRPLVQGEDFWASFENGRLVYSDSAMLDLPPPRLIGAHQVENAGLAIAACRHFGLPADADAIAEGLRRVSWPARLTPLSGPLREALSPGHELWLDGGHNAHGAAALARAVRDMEHRRPAPLVLVLGMMNTRDPAEFLAPFAGRATAVIALAIPGEPNGHEAEAIAVAARAAGFKAYAEADLHTALAAAAGIPDARVVICGSLYLAGHVLAENGTPPD